MVPSLANSYLFKHAAVTGQHFIHSPGKNKSQWYGWYLPTLERNMSLLLLPKMMIYNPDPQKAGTLCKTKISYLYQQWFYDVFLSPCSNILCTIMCLQSDEP